MGDEEVDFWRGFMEAAGYHVKCVIEGLGSVDAIHEIYVAHAQKAVDEALS